MADSFPRHLLCLATRRAVSNRNRLDAVLLNQFLQTFGALQVVQEDHVVQQHVALFVQHDGLTTGTETGIECQHPFLSERCAQQQLA